MAASAKPQPKKPEAAVPGAVVGLARGRFIRGSTRKTREVARLVRARPVTEALAILATANKRAARALSVVMRSAAANALQRHPQLTPEALRVTRIVIDEGPMWKRFRAVAMGRATRIRKRTSHITVELSGGAAG